jgi:hypothetical protein
MPRTIPRAGWPLGLLFLLLCSGCGPAGPEIVPVKGTITFGGGPWPETGEVRLLPIEAAPGEPLIPTMVTLAKDGSFTAESTVGAGLVPGKYRVAVECWKLPPDDSRAESPFGVSYVGNKWRDPATSGLEFEVKSGDPGPVEVKFDIPKSG